jgi:hypothetical protein
MNLARMTKEQAYQAGVKAGREAERQECWFAINKHIHHGPLPGNGTDKHAQRNGMVLACNLIIERCEKNQKTSRK